MPSSLEVLPLTDNTTLIPDTFGSAAPKWGVLFRGTTFRGKDTSPFMHVTRYPEVAAGYATSGSGVLSAYRSKGLSRAGETHHLAINPEDAFKELAQRRARSVRGEKVHESKSAFNPPDYEDIVKKNKKPPAPLAQWKIKKEPKYVDSRPVDKRSFERRYRDKDGNLVSTRRTIAVPLNGGPTLDHFMPSGWNKY